MTNSTLFSEKLIQDWNNIMKNEPLIHSVKKIVEFNKVETPALDQDGSLGVEINFERVFGGNLVERLQDFKNKNPETVATPGVYGEPVPPLRFIRGAEHHWLEKIDCDGHVWGILVLQWNPGAKRWSTSGNVGTGHYISTVGWRYVAHCPVPEF